MFRNNILKSRVMRARKKDVENVIYNKGTIRLWDLKLSFSVNYGEPKIIKREQIRKDTKLEILDIADDNYTFVVHPDKRIQETKNGGTIKVLTLKKGYELENIVEFYENGGSKEGGLNLSELGLNFKYENVNKESSTIKVKKLTHEHLVLLINANIERNMIGQKRYDSAEIKLDYIRINKDHERELCRAIDYERSK